MRTLATMLRDRRDTTTTMGLGGTASLLQGVYRAGQRVAEAVMQTRSIAQHAVCPQWNETIPPRP